MVRTGLVATLILVGMMFTSSSKGGNSRCLMVTSGPQFGTAIVLRTNLVVTDFHILARSEETKVDGKQVKIVGVSTDKDLVFISMITDEFEMVRFGDAAIGDEVYYEGNSAGHKCIVAKGVVVDIIDDVVFIDIHLLPGGSGSGVYNKKGELVAIAQSIENVNGLPGFALGMSSRVIRRMLP